jgi:hypothetical protein
MAGNEILLSGRRERPAEIGYGPRVALAGRMRCLAAAVVILQLGSSFAFAESRGADYARLQRALNRAPAPWTSALKTPPPASVMRGAQQPEPARRDSVWNGALIGGAIGGPGGYVWARNICGNNDSECFAIAGPVGILGGAGIGLAVGAIADALHK